MRSSELPKKLIYKKCFHLRTRCEFASYVWINKHLLARTAAPTLAASSQLNLPSENAIRGVPKALHTRACQMVREPNARMCGQDCEPALRHP